MIFGCQTLINKIRLSNINKQIIMDLPKQKKKIGLECSNFIIIGGKVYFLKLGEKRCNFVNLEEKKI